MKINWKVRFKNKTWLGAMGALVLSFVYSLLGLLGVTPEFTHNQAAQVLNNVLMLLALLGVIQDPTTAGLYDSDRAMSYDEPWVDFPEDPEPEVASHDEDDNG